MKDYYTMALLLGMNDCEVLRELNTLNNMLIRQIAITEKLEKGNNLLRLALSYDAIDYE
jgi:hypothetical protein